MKKVGRYEIHGLLGRGGMGMVYKVSMPVVGKMVALKRLAPHPNLVSLLGSEEIHRRFVTEAVTMARLRHPNIVAIWDFHDDEDLTYFVMEYFCKSLGSVIGETYRVERSSRVLSVDRAIDYTLQVLEGLERLHNAGIIHRDIKPYNVLITEQDRAKITDFGLSALHGETFGGPSNLMVGSPYYAAPEQEANPNDVDVRADLYPVGVMLYRMLTGVLPTEETKGVEHHHPDLDGTWDAFLAQAMAADRKDRFESAKAMSAALEKLKVQWEEKKDKICQIQGLETGPVSTASSGPLTLRSRGEKVPSRVARSRFGLDEKWRPKDYVQNDFRLRGGDMVKDHRTGLVWQQGGSDYPLTWYEAHDYVAALNAAETAGAHGWRLPTVDEVMSLLTQIPRASDLCMELVFSPTQRWLWSCDRSSFVAAWYADVELGYVARQDFSCYYYVRAVSSDRD